MSVRYYGESVKLKVEAGGSSGSILPFSHLAFNGDKMVINWWGYTVTTHPRYTHSHHTHCHINYLFQIFPLFIAPKNNIIIQYIHFPHHSPSFIQYVQFPHHSTSYPSTTPIRSLECLPLIKRLLPTFTTPSTSLLKYTPSPVPYNPLHSVLLPYQTCKFLSPRFSREEPP